MNKFIVNKSNLKISKSFLFGCLFLLLMFVHFQKLNKAFPLDRILDPWPLLKNEYAPKAYSARLDEGYRERTKQDVIYDPSINNGQVMAPVLTSRTRFYVLINRLGGVKAYKVVLFVFILFTPFLIYLSCRLFSFDQTSAFVSMCLFVGGFNFWNLLSTWILRMGFFEAYLAHMLCLVSAGLLARMAHERTIKATVPLTLIIALILAIYPGATLILIPVVTYLLIQIRDRKKYLGVILGSLGIALTLNLFWIFPFLQYRHILEEIFIKTTQSSISDFHMFNFINQGDYLVFLRVLRIVVFLGAIAGMVKLHKENNNRQSNLFVIWILFLFIIGFFGSHAAFIKALNPRLVLHMMGLVVLIPAGFVLTKFYHRQGGFEKIIIVWAFLYFLSYSHSFSPNLILKSQYLELQKMVKKISSHLSGNGNILWEHRWQFPRPIEVALVSNYKNLFFDDYVNRPKFNYFLTIQKNKKYFAFFYSKFFRSIKLNELLEILSRMNVGTIVVKDLAVRSRLDQHKSLFYSESIINVENDPYAEIDIYEARHQVENNGHPGGFELRPFSEAFRIYKVNTAGSFFIEGSGRIKTHLNGIDIENPSVGKLILKYKWNKGLSTNSPAVISPMVFDSDPFPYIHLDVPPGMKKISIQFSPNT